jgi:predicted amidohydrolase
VAAIDRAEAAFYALLDDLASLEDPNRTWLNIATRLLMFCHEFAPSASAWVDDSADPWRAILDVQVRAIADLKKVDPTFFPQPPGQKDGNGGELDSRPLASSSSATPEHVQALLNAARDELNHQPFQDKRMSRAVVARGLAGAIDNLAGSTYLEFFRALGQVTITEGEPYPVSHYDPRHWLGKYGANTEPDKFPNRDLSFTTSLRIATGKLGFTYVLDFGLWDRLSLLGAKDDCLVMSAAQPNLNFSEVDFRWHGATTPPTYSNHGPDATVPQVDRIVRLVDEATAQGAEVVLVPEYSVTESTYTALMKQFSLNAIVPIVFCAGLVRDTLAKTGYMQNEGWLLVNTPGISQGYSEHFHAKTSAAKLKEAVERIRPASEVRVFVGERWSLCVLICVEVLATEIVDQLAKIGTNLILVPAMSERTTSMAASVSRLCSESQAFVVMANGPADWLGMNPASRCEAFFAGPYESSPSEWCLTLADLGRDAKKIATWVFPASQKTVSVHQLSP